MSYWKDSSKLGLDFVAPREFLQANGFTKAVQYVNAEVIEKILENGTFSSYGVGHPKENVPYIDHGIIYKNPSTKTCCLVYIPYQYASHIKEAVTQWAISKGLVARLYEHSWYSVGTCLVIISTPYANINTDMLSVFEEI